MAATRTANEMVSLDIEGKVDKAAGVAAKATGAAANGGVMAGMSTAAIAGVAVASSAIVGLVIAVAVVASTASTASTAMGGACAAAFDSTVDGCEIAIVGAGAGGFYTAFRMTVDAGVRGSSICIFEADSRHSGRILSLRGQGDPTDPTKRDLVVDAGGYRTFDTISPRTQYLIVNRTGLTLGCYDPISCLGKVIVNSQGHRIGYGTFVERLYDIVTARGVRVMLERPLIKLEKLGTSAAPRTRLTFTKPEGGLVTTISSRVVITIPQYPLLEVLRNSPGLGVTDPLERAIHAVQPVYAVKLYLYYPDAWWVTRFGLREGSFVSDGNAVTPPLQGRYHDGEIRCTRPANAPANWAPGIGSSCYGFLQTQYFWDFSGKSQNYFGRFQNNRSSVVTHLSTTADGMNAIMDVHNEVMRYHNLTAAHNIPQPREGVLVTYNLATPWANSAWHYWTDASKASVLQDFLETDNIHLVNEAYSPAPSWAEGAIVLADQLMNDLYGLNPPHSPVTYRARNYISELWNDAPATDPNGTVAPICLNTCMRNGASFAAVFARDGSCHDGALASTCAGTGCRDSTLTAICDYGTDCQDCGPRPGSGSAAEGAAEDPACFIADAKLLLADGSRIPLAKAQVGMRVASALGQGTITAVLRHPVNATVKRFRLPTAHGDLVGTLSHPVFVNASWLEAEEAAALGLLPGLTTELAHVDEYYNLEIDGDQPEIGAHAYELNGHVVSGLGDNEVLNQRFARQKVFRNLKHATAAA